MPSRYLFIAIAIGALLLVPASASADIPPPEGYVEQCTIDNAKADGETCESCGTYHGEMEKCVELYEGKGWTKRCQTRGASVWTEIWCAPAGTASPAGPKPAEPTPTEPESVAPAPTEPAPAEPATDKTASKTSDTPKAVKSGACSAASPVGGGTFALLLAGLLLVWRRAARVARR